VLNVVFMERAECNGFLRSRDFNGRAKEYFGQIALYMDGGI
jgi:hypothetical protein